MLGGMVQVVLRHGQLRMYSNREVVRSGKDGRGLFVVINGLVRIGYQDPLGNTQEYFLGTGVSKAFLQSVPIFITFQGSVLLYDQPSIEWNRLICSPVCFCKLPSGNLPTGLLDSPE